MIQVNFFLLSPRTWEYNILTMNNETPLHAQLNKLSSNMFCRNQNHLGYDDRRWRRQDEGFKFLNRSSSKLVEIGRCEAVWHTSDIVKEHYYGLVCRWWRRFYNSMLINRNTQQVWRGLVIQRIAVLTHVIHRGQVDRFRSSSTWLN